MDKILVVEDTETVREEVITILEMEGYSVESAENGKIGLEKIHSFHPDLVLCDIMMPVMDGYALLAELRKDPTISDTPFIFLTAKATSVDSRIGMNLGADDYITKPFQMQELLDAVSIRIEKSRDQKQKVESLRQNISWSMPHELRTPLTGILGLARLIIQQGAMMEIPEIIEIAQMIESSGERLHRLVENYLFYVQLEMLSMDIEKLSYYRLHGTSLANESIQSFVISLFERTGRYPDLIFDGSSIDFVAIEETHLLKIVEELVDNSMKFSSKGQKITIRVRKNDENRFELSVIDQGVGMESDQIASIGAYVQFDRARREQQGIGMGLAIVQRIIKIYEGTLTIHSNKNQGTTVTVVF